MNVYYFIYRCWQKPKKILRLFYQKWNFIKFRYFGIKFGKKLTVYNSIYTAVPPGAKIVIGDNFVFNSGNNLNPLSRNIKGCLVAKPYAEIIIGDWVGMSSVCVWAHKSIKIGNYVNIGGDVIIMDSDAHSLNYIHRRKRGKQDRENKIDKGIVIDDDVLIGTRSIILKGVHIGARSIIGAGSVVVNDIPADCIAAGNPCRVIKRNIKD